ATDTQVLGVSMDSPYANKAWAEKIGVTFPLLSDWGGETTRRYGIYSNEYKAAKRTTYLIDKSGKIVEVHEEKQALDPANVVTACERRKLKE
ncbi:MAG TPA: redoxin domain-containing protein, partial [Bryobacteraceae bacterium]|nr:redoxin domain-containing protein [Bryobacteraceae bacterium]